jgi:hypothetical protein
VVGSCTSHPGVLGSIPKREEPGKTGAPCVKSTGFLKGPPPPPPCKHQLCTRSCNNKHTQIEQLPRPGWAPDPLMVGIRSRWAGGWVLHQSPWSFGFDFKREEPDQGNRAPPCVKVPGSSRVPAPPRVGSRSPDGWDQIPRWTGGWVHQSPWSFGFDSQTRGTEETGRHGWWLGLTPVTLEFWLGLTPVTLEFWVRFPKEK